jgi:hypothetical protein
MAGRGLTSAAPNPRVTSALTAEVGTLPSVRISEPPDMADKPTGSVLGHVGSVVLQVLGQAGQVGKGQVADEGEDHESRDYEQDNNDQDEDDETQSKTGGRSADGGCAHFAIAGPLTASSLTASFLKVRKPLGVPFVARPELDHLGPVLGGDQDVAVFQQHRFRPNAHARTLARDP